MNERRKIFELFEKNKPELEKKIRDGIEAHRKGDAKITVRDAEGNAVEGACVHLAQKCHAFRFGANLFMLEELETPQKNEIYQARFAELFNMATLPFYWDATEPERGKTRYTKDSPRIYRRPPIDLCIEYCEKNGIEPREHALAYESFFPKWLYNAPIDEVKNALENRFREVSERYADKIRTMEITNEMEWDNGRTPFYNDPDYVAWCFKLAEKYFPKNQLGINEWYGLAWEDRGRVTDKYYLYIQNALLKGARIDAIGMQYHMFFPRECEYEKTRRAYDPDSLFRHMDLYATFGKPLQLTEVTVPSYSWEKEDEEIQAELLEILYSIWFSHPAMEQIVYWNLVDGYAAFAPQGDMTAGENYYRGGLLRFDMSPKPAFLALKRLIHETWHTEEERITSSDGNATLRGFYGEYECTVTAGGKTVTLPLSLKKGGENTFAVTV